MEENLDKKYKSVLETIKLYPDQLKQAWEDGNKIDLPDDYSDILNIVFCGMGGSALGARMVDSMTEESARIPFEIFTNYNIPSYTGEKTLVVISSYSGNTEESLSCLQQAKQKGAKIFGITTGGKLKEELEKEYIPAYIINPKFNPSGQPRMALGYSVGAILPLINKLNVSSISGQSVLEAESAMKSSFEQFGNESDPEHNKAKKLAVKLYKKFPVFVASDHLVGVAHSIKNQINETAKTFSVQFDLPELNHHLLEGLKHPSYLKSDAIFILIHSHLYHDRTFKRYPLTAEVIKKNGFEFSIFHPKEETKLSQIFEVFVFGSLLTYFLTKEYKEDPTKIPWVDYFKEKLAEN